MAGIPPRLRTLPSVVSLSVTTESEWIGRSIDTSAFKGGNMTITRRDFVLGTASGLALATQGLTRATLAQGAGEPIRFGWLAALTGPSSAPAIGFDRGNQATRLAGRDFPDRPGCRLL